ncbi:MAG TPA: hypothetical protein VE913_24260 [Longimicrobium sp.]|nr:hypothetical protein [Longimicrobium sp.]
MALRGCVRPLELIGGSSTISFIERAECLIEPTLLIVHIRCGIWILDSSRNRGELAQLRREILHASRQGHAEQIEVRRPRPVIADAPGPFGVFRDPHAQGEVEAPKLAEQPRLPGVLQQWRRGEELPSQQRLPPPEHLDGFPQRCRSLGRAAVRHSTTCW